MVTAKKIGPPTNREAEQGWEDGLWLDPKWSQQMLALVEGASEPVGIDPKWMALVALAVDAAPQSLYPQGMRRHMRRALALGATRQEIAAVLRYVSVSGQHSIKLGASILKEELAMGACFEPAARAKKAVGREVNQA